MEAKDVLRSLREKSSLTQEQLAERLLVTRQAVSRWENGETQPNPETLKLLSREFNVSINTLLGSPRVLICQCCGMPLGEDGLISREPDGRFNEEYCKWCYADGAFTYSDKTALIDYIAGHFPAPEGASEAEYRAQLDKQLSGLKHWK
ncbi:MAG: helix-turn-helix domain-containing protein [Oscillospiraceae bacterium]|nr:helix-turn-helix domain-containing protein [Oscillospiraceae bacterium]